MPPPRRSAGPRTRTGSKYQPAGPPHESSGPAATTVAAPQRQPTCTASPTQEWPCLGSNQRLVPCEGSAAITRPCPVLAPHRIAAAQRSWGPGTVWCCMRRCKACFLANSWHGLRRAGPATLAPSTALACRATSRELVSSHIYLDSLRLGGYAPACPGRHPMRFSAGTVCTPRPSVWCSAGVSDRPHSTTVQRTTITRSYGPRSVPSHVRRCTTPSRPSPTRPPPAHPAGRVAGPLREPGR
jgi:hypothetical protein